MVVVVWYLTFGTYWDLNLGIGLDSKNGVVYPEENQHCFYGWQLTQRRPLLFPQAMKINPIKGNSEAVYYREAGRATSTGSGHATPTAAGKASLAKKMHQTWKTQCLHFHQGLPICPQFTGSHPFSIKAIIKYLKDWKFRFLCNSVTEWDSAFDFQEFQP